MEGKKLENIIDHFNQLICLGPEQAVNEKHSLGQIKKINCYCKEFWKA